MLNTQLLKLMDHVSNLNYYILIVSFWKQLFHRSGDVPT